MFIINQFLLLELLLGKFRIDPRVCVTFHVLDNVNIFPLGEALFIFKNNKEFIKRVKNRHNGKEGGAENLREGVENGKGEG